jgi:hypothetical protein
MLPIVVVEVGVQAPPAQHQQALIEACSRALQRGRCMVADPELEPAQPQAVAIVSWDEEQQRVRVEVGVRHDADKEEWVSRQMRFDPHDAPVERWRSVGLTIASLVGELRPELSEMPQPEATRLHPARDSKAALSGPGSSTAPPEQLQGTEWPEAFLLEGGFGLGSGLSDGPSRWGGYGRLGYQLSGAPLSFALAGRLSVRPGETDVSIRWIDLGVQAGAYTELGSTDVQAELRAVALLQQIRAAAGEDSDARWVPVLGLRADAVWPARGFLAVVLGTEGRLVTERTTIRNAGEKVGENPLFEASFEFGLRLCWEP